MPKNILSLYPMEKIMKKAGADRVSEEAKEELRQHLEEVGRKISERAISLSRHAGRKTIKKDDVRLARDSF